MSAYSSVQHVAAGVGSFLAGLIIVEGPDRTLRNYAVVGLIGFVATLLSVWLAGRIEPVSGLAAPSATDQPANEMMISSVETAEAF